MADTSQSNISFSHGFPPPEDLNKEEYENIVAQYIQILKRRALRWNKVLGQPTLRSKKFKRFVRKGIPNEHRAAVWFRISGAQENMDENPDLYQSLLKEPRDPALVDSINLDLHRTFPENDFFSKEIENNKLVPLFNVLLAFAQQNKKIGYCQGLNYIAGVMLLIVQDEKKTFWLFKTLLEDILPGYHSKDMKDLLLDSEVLGELMKLKVPSVPPIMEKYEVSWTLLTTKWLICLFIDVLPIETVLRIWDSLFYEGTKVMFRVIVTLVIKNQKHITSCTSMPEIVDTFKKIVKDPVVLDCHNFMQSIFQVPGSFPMATITKLREQCESRVILPPAK